MDKKEKMFEVSGPKTDEDVRTETQELLTPTVIPNVYRGRPRNSMYHFNVKG